MSAAEWFISQNGEQVGPITNAELQAMNDSGAIDGKAYIWGPGFSAWRLAIEFFPPKLSSRSPPPLPLARTGPSNALCAPSDTPESAWEHFRNHLTFYRGTRVIQKIGHIQFSQRNNNISNRGVATLIIGSIALYIGPLIFFASSNLREGTAFFLLWFLLSPLIIGPGYLIIFFWVLKRHTYIDIYPDRVTIKTPNDAITLASDEISNLDVRQIHSVYGIYFWRLGRPVPFPTLSEPNLEYARAIRDGLAAAILLLSKLRQLG